MTLHARAQSGNFVIPAIRSEGHTDFAYWDLFARPPGSPANTNYNHPNPPALADGFGEDDSGNATTAFAPRAILTQTGTPNCFITSSGAIYSFSDPLAFEVAYSAPSGTPGEITNVIFQTQSGGARLNLNGVVLRYESGGQSHDITPLYRALDDPQSGAFSERIVCAFQWNLTGLNLRHFKIVFTTPVSMPLWQAQIDAAIATPFEQVLGYLMATRSRPITRHDRAGYVDKNLPATADGRFFLAGDVLNLLSEPEAGWLGTGWHYNNGGATTGATLPLVFPAQDITVTALFAPQAYATWRAFMFYHANALLGTENDYTNDAVSASAVDHDGDGLDNAGEYAFGGDPYVADDARTRPQMLVVDMEGVQYPALRYRTNGAPAGSGDCAFRVQVSRDGGASWADNLSVPGTTVIHLRELQADGSALVTERTSAALNGLGQVEMAVAWSVGGVGGRPRVPLALNIVAPSELPAGTMGVAYSQDLGPVGGVAPYQWRIAAGALPAGVALSVAGVIDGVPTAHGTYSFTVELEDALGTRISRALTLSLAPFEITTNSTLDAVPAGSPVNVQLEALGGTGPYVWSLAPGSGLPQGLVLSSGGLLSGNAATAGDYSFAIQVSDATPLTVGRLFHLRVIDLSVRPQELPTAVVNVPYSAMLAGSGGTTPYVWTVVAGSPPAGITLSPSGGLSGAASGVGTSTFTVQIQDAYGFTAAREVTLAVSGTYLRPEVPAQSFPAATVGVLFNQAVTVLNHPKSISASGLPRGLRIAATTGLISGRPEVSGVFNVQIQGVNAAGRSLIRTLPLVVRAVEKNLLGSFTALVDRHPAVNQQMGSKLELTVTSRGSFSVKLTTGTKAVSTTGFLAAGAPHISLILGGQPLLLTLSPSMETLHGTYGSASVAGWRLVWNKAARPAESRDGYYSFAMNLADTADDGVASIPQGAGFASFGVALSGVLTVVGKTADGETVAASAALGPNGQICLYVPLYRSSGSLTGSLLLSEDARGEFWENTLTGSLTWSKPVSATRAYAGGFGPVRLSASGGYLAATNKELVLGLPEPGEAELSFSDGGLADSATDPDLTFGYTDDNKVVLAGAAASPARVALVINKSTGAVSGKFSLTETAPPLVRKDVPFTGQTVRHADGRLKAVGYFLLPQIPVGSQKITNSPVLSGAFVVTQP